MPGITSFFFFPLPKFHPHSVSLLYDDYTIVVISIAVRTAGHEEGKELVHTIFLDLGSNTDNCNGLL